MVKPTVFSAEQDPKKGKPSDIHLIAVKEVPFKSGFEDHEPLITARTQVCTLQRCACTVMLVLIALGCLVGASIGLYLHLNDKPDPTLIVAGAGHPYGNDALYPPDFFKPARVGGHFDQGITEFHHGSLGHEVEPIRPRRPFPGVRPPFPVGGPPLPDGYPPLRERTFAQDAFEPPHVIGGGHGKELHERPREPHGRRHDSGPIREKRPEPHLDHHHGGREGLGRRMRGRGERPREGNMP